ncbi:MAG TPA: amino acid synthesis family protein [Eoetvoesiella sp.]
MQLPIKRWLTFIEETPGEDESQAPLRKVAIGVVLDNPYAGRGFVEDLKPLVQASIDLGRQIGEVAAETMKSYGVQSYGKAGLVGINGEQEHVNALLTSEFADPIRKAIGGGKAWISSVTKRASAGDSIDIPLAHKDAVYVRSHYNSITVTFADVPAPDEVVILMGFANRGRIHARVGGIQHADVKGLDGLT